MSRFPRFTSASSKKVNSIYIYHFSKGFADFNLATDYNMLSVPLPGLLPKLRNMIYTEILNDEDLQASRLRRT